MGSHPTAHLAYGYDLGDFDGFRITQVDEYGGLTVPWWDDDGEEFAVQFYDALYAAIPDAPAESNPDRRQAAAEHHFGVEIAFMGSDQFEGWLLIAAGSEREAVNAQAMVLDLHDMEHPPDGAFDRLTTAVEALGITPTQEWPRWLVYPSHG